MERIKIRLHPLFLAVGALSCFVGKLPLFLTFTLSALLHEGAHALAAGRLGYQLNEILLMPYGAVIRGDLTEVRKKEELFIDLSGPFFSGAIALATLALWWLFPDCYPYTEDVFTANRTLFLTNLLPVYPLDGGRAVKTLWKKAFGEKRGELLSRIFSGAAAVALTGWCIYRMDYAAALFFSSLLFGCFGGGEYRKISFTHIDSFRRGIPIRRIAVCEDATVKKILRFFSADSFLFVDVFSGKGEYLFSCRQDEVEWLFESKGIYARIGEISPIKDEKYGKKSLI